MLSVREEPEADTDKVFVEGEDASIKFELSSGDIMTVQRKSSQRNPVIFINGDRLGHVVNDQKPTKEVFFNNERFSSSSCVTASASPGAMPIGYGGVSQIELKESGYLPDIYIDGEWIGWLRLDGSELTLSMCLTDKYTARVMG